MAFELPTLTLDFLLAASPIFLMFLSGLVLMLAAVSPTLEKPGIGFGLIGTFLIASLGASLFLVPLSEKNHLAGTVISGLISAFGQSTILMISLIVVLLFQETSLKSKFFRGEILSLYSFCVAGMLVMVASSDIITLFVGLEIASICLYVLAGYTDPNRKSQEGAIKYFVLGSFGTALLLMGFALIYSATGLINLKDLVVQIPKLADHRWVQLGSIFLVSGLAFKLAMAPFHLWAPDTYEASPTGITAFMATSVKVMMIVFAFRLFSQGLIGAFAVWLPALVFLAMSSMIIGNMMALVQSSLKRMLAYSSIAHGGYMSLGLCALGTNSLELPLSSVMFYLVSYSLVSLCAFGIIMWLESGVENLTLQDIQGLSTKHPWAALCLAASMFALAGMPPTGGFIAKLFVFKAALDSQLYSLVLVGALGSALSLFYYLRVIVKMYMTKPHATLSALSPKPSLILACLLGTIVVTVLLLGTILPEALFQQLLKAAENIALN